MSDHKFPYEWKLSDGYPAQGVEHHGTKVFTTFSCGGGSSMGYKLAGYDVIAAEDIDPKMKAAYLANHHPKYYFLEGVKEFKDRDNIPEELFGIDVLDGSPPCTSFSMAGNREEDWGKSKKFREGQTDQVLDTLFFDFIDLAKKLQPKVVIAENVKGILLGGAKDYSRRIIKGFEEAGYVTQHFLLNASFMGVPQARERVFFISIRKDIAAKLPKRMDMLFDAPPKIDMDFDEPIITFRDATEKYWHEDRKALTPTAALYWDICKEGDSFASVHPKGSLFNWIKVAQDKPTPTLASGSAEQTYHPTIPGVLTLKEWCMCGSWPIDYVNNSKYMIGMSVPPVMMAHVADRIYKHVFAVINAYGLTKPTEKAVI